MKFTKKKRKESRTRQNRAAGTSQDQNPKAQPVKRIGRTVIVLIIIATLTAGILASGGIWYLNRFASSPKGSSTVITPFSIRPGRNLSKIARELDNKGLISSRTLFKFMVRLQKKSSRLQAGEYDLSASMTPQEILDRLTRGGVRLHRITIPEGLNLEEIAELVREANLDPKDEFLKLCRDPVFVREMEIPGSTLEGYLFPDTYLFAGKTQAPKLISTMIHRFNTVFKESWQKKAEQMGFSVHQVVTLASIIEKETGKASERPLIASVFHNRLKRGMRLESDPTVIYGIPDFNGNITRKDLRTPTPYNTYVIRGLPPGPIASPGALSLEAALYPAETDYLFFVSKNDTTHKFSATLREHNRAVRKYQLGK